MSNIKLCAFADESGAAIDHQIAALKRNAIPYLEIRNVDGTNISNIALEKAKEVGPFTVQYIFMKKRNGQKLLSGITMRPMKRPVR